MAWVQGEWNGRVDRQAKIEKLRRWITPRVKRKSELSNDDKADLVTHIREFKRLQAIDRAEDDLLYFVYRYFSENENADNSGNWVPYIDPDEVEKELTEAAPEFHHEICDLMNVVSNEERNKRVAVAAPRSHAKSSFLSKGFPIHEIVYRKRAYIILISETPTVSSANLEWIKIQLQNNEKLRQDFGPLFHPKRQMNPRDNSSEFVAWLPKGEDQQHQLTLVQAASTGQALRGRNWNGKRPDLIICDDLEDKRNTNTEQLRQELSDWFRQVVVPLGDPEGKRTAIVMMGTTVHPQSLLIDVINNRSDFQSKIYRAIRQHPERDDLWEHARQLYTDHENANRAREAEAFYVANRAEMDRGVEVLWPKVQPIWKLMTWKWDNGSKAFNTEYMNNPIDTESMLFNPNTFTYWSDKDANRIFPHEQYDISMGVDFALGKERGDYSAVTVVARHKETETAYVIDSYGERLHPDEFIEVITERTLEHQPDVIAAESNAAQEFFVDVLTSKLASAGYPSFTRIRKVKNRSRKELRIEAMKPAIENGALQFDRKHNLLLEQFEYYGTGGTHDDLPDSLEMAYSAATQKQPHVRTLRKRTYSR